MGAVGPLDLSRPPLPPPPGMAVAGHSSSSHNFGASSSSTPPTMSQVGHQRQQRQQQQYGDAYLGDTAGFSSEVSGGCSSTLPHEIIITAAAPAFTYVKAPPPIPESTSFRPLSSTAVLLESMSSCLFCHWRFGKCGRPRPYVTEFP